MTNFICPNCGSENIQKLQMVYQLGTASRSAVTKNQNGEESTTSEYSSTSLAASVAPPTKKETAWLAMIVCAFIAVGIVYFFRNSGWIKIIGGGFFSLCAIGCCFGSVEASKWNETEYPTLYAQWARSFICHKCGHRFII